MATGQQNINIGTGDNANDGDVLRAAFRKVRKMFAEIYGDTDAENLTDTETVPSTSFDTHITEKIQDVVGGMVTGNTETNITVTYDDADGTLDFVVAADIESVNAGAGLTGVNEGSGDVTVNVGAGAGVTVNPNDIAITTQDLYVDNTNNRVGINTSSPSYTLDVAGNAGFDEYLYHNDDANTFMRFQNDTINLNAGNTKVDLQNGRLDLLETDSSNLAVRLGSSASDGTIGVYYNGAVKVGLTGASASYFFNNLGIGTSTPSANLHVKSAGNGEIEVERTSGALINIQAQSAKGVIGTDTNHTFSIKTNATERMLIEQGGDVKVTNSIFAGTYRSSRTDGDLYLQAATDSDFVAIGTQTSPNLFRFNSTGLGIGTTSPKSILELSGTNPVLNFKDTGGATDQKYFYLQGSGDKFYISSANDAYDTFATHVTIDRNSNVGIGTTSPSGELHIKSSSSNANLFIQRAAYTAWQMSAGSTYLSFQQQGGSELMRIASSGRVGIGTTSPSGVKLEVNQSADNEGIALSNSTRGSSRILWELAGATNDGHYFKHDNGTNKYDLWYASRDQHSFYTANTERMRIESNGAVVVTNTLEFGSLKDSGEDITVTKFVDEADSIESNKNDTTIPTSAAVDDHIKVKRQDSYKVIGLAMDYLSRVNDDGGTVEGMEEVMLNTEKLILA